MPGGQPPAPPAPPGQGQRTPYPESFPIFTKLNTSIHAAGQLCPSLARSLQQQQLHVGRRLRPAAATALAEAAAGGGSGCYPPPAGSWACSISQELAIHLRAALPLRPPLPCPLSPRGGLQARARCRGSRRQPRVPAAPSCGTPKGQAAAPLGGFSRGGGGRYARWKEGGGCGRGSFSSRRRCLPLPWGSGGRRRRRPRRAPPAGSGRRRRRGRREPAGPRGVAAPRRGRGSGLEGGCPPRGRGGSPGERGRGAPEGRGEAPWAWGKAGAGRAPPRAAAGGSRQPSVPPWSPQSRQGAPVGWGRGCGPSASALGDPQPRAADRQRGAALPGHHPRRG